MPSTATASYTDNRYQNIDIGKPIDIAVMDVGSDSLELHIKIGIIKDLCENKLLTQKQMEAAIKILYRKETAKCRE